MKITRTGSTVVYTLLNGLILGTHIDTPQAYVEAKIKELENEDTKKR